MIQYLNEVQFSILRVLSKAKCYRLDLMSAIDGLDFWTTKANLATLRKENLVKQCLDDDRCDYYELTTQGEQVLDSLARSSGYGPFSGVMGGK